MTLQLIQMGKCMSWLSGKRRKNCRNVTIAMFGIDNAGKTVTVKGLQGESLDDVAPTIGFQSAEFYFSRHNVTIYDLGGGKGIRDIWTQYYSQVYGIIYVIDSSALERLHETKQALHGLLSDKRISGKPILVLANKQDVEGAMDETDLCDALSLEDTVNQYRTPCRVETCTATSRRGHKPNKTIKAGFKWLLTSINQNWPELSERVEQESEIQRTIDAKERQLKRERVQKIREERERLEGKEEDEGPDVPITGDPFKPLDLAELTAKDERLKEEKRRLKASLTSDKPPGATRSPRRDTSSPSGRVAWESPEKDDVDTTTTTTKSHSNDIELTNVPRQVNDLSEDSNSNNNTRRSGLDSPFVTGRTSETNADLEEVRSSIKKVHALDGSDTSTPREEKKKQKKKKKRVRANQTAPVAEDSDDHVTVVPPPSTWLAGPGKENDQLAPIRSSGTDLAAGIRTPRKLEPIGQTSSAQPSMNENWSLDLPPLVQRATPNADDEDIVMT